MQWLMTAKQPTGKGRIAKANKSRWSLWKSEVERRRFDESLLSLDLVWSRPPTKPKKPKKEKVREKQVRSSEVAAHCPQCTGTGRRYVN